ncbi:MAG: 3-hydroxyacyl-[acyl-carrier-protein] dehydratase [Luteibaculaceae bacterium]|jgi:3-hydroxyacyl-[acyl-carrier-protein] dehydratase
MTDSLSFDIIGIQECQRNRYPLLFIDRIFNVIPGKQSEGLKSFTFNEWFFPAHFDDDPNVPGFVQIECLVQTFIMTFLCMDQYKGMKTSFVSVDNVKFRKKIVPGDQLKVKAYLSSFKRGIAKGYAESFVDGSDACRADFIIAIPDVLSAFKPK